MAGVCGPKRSVASGFPPLVERPWTACRVKRPRGIRRCPTRWTSASQRSSPRSPTRSTSPRASRWATPCARARSACGSARRSASTTDARSSLFYALLLKDAGCSSNAAKLSALFGADDLELKRARKLTDHLRPVESLKYTRPPRPAPAGSARDRPQRRRAAPRDDDRAALRARRRDRAHDRADRGDRRGDPGARRALGRQRLPATASPATRSRCSAASSASPRPPRCSSPPPARARRSTSPPTAAAPGSTLRSSTRCAPRAATVRSGRRSAATSRTR